MARTNDYELTVHLWADGSQLFQFMDRWQDWIARRIECIEFDDDRTLRRTTTLDLDLSKEDVDDLPQWRGRLLVPVKLLSRDFDNDATVTDAGGLPLPQLTRRHERSLVAAGLMDMYAGDLTDPGEVHGAILSNIDRDLFSGPEDLRTTDQVFLDAVQRFRRERLLVAAVEDPGPTADGMLLRLQVIHSEGLPADGYEGVKALPVARRTRKRPDDDVFVFRIPQVDACESFHLEVVAPHGVLISESHLTVRRALTDPSRRAAVMAKARAAPERERASILAEGLTPLRTVADDDPHAERMHVYYGPPREGSVFLAAAALLVFRPLTAGTMRPGLFVSILCSTVLVLLWVTIGWSGCPWTLPDQVTIAYDPQVEAVVAGVLLGPTLVAGVLANADEHLLTKRFIFRHRLRLAAQASACFFAAAAYAVGMPSQGRWWLLGTLAVGSLALTVQSGRSYQASRDALKSARVTADV